MSGPLVPLNSQFAQQGSVDWVALSNTSVQFSVAVLSRLSRAGIDAFTLQVGRAICFNFALEPDGQERVSSAILKLKRYGSYGDLIWFGFGIREVVTDLADTEEGLTLVALCAALSTTYDALFAAKVLRELCLLCKAPQSFSPALRQWKALVELCAGILSSAHFVLLVNGFRRLISGSSPHIVESRYTPTNPSALAEAILTLARISRHSLVNAVVSGGIDCAWLAAFAEWILSLDVEICDARGGLLYRSNGTVEGLPSVTILLFDTSEGMPQASLLRKKTTVLPIGQTLLQKDPALCGVGLLNMQSSWSTILRDVFHDSISMLLDHNSGTHFAILLRCMSTLYDDNAQDDLTVAEREVLATSWANHPVNPLLRIHSNGGGQGYLAFAAKRLPELHGCLSASRPLSHNDTGDLGRRALQNIECLCSCAFHRPGIETDDDSYFCLRTVAETIVVYLWVLVDADIDDDVFPSITGLINLYSWQSRANKAQEPANGPWYSSMMNCDYPALGIDLVFHVLSGVSVSGTPPKAEALPTIGNLARVGNGICIYHYAVEDPAFLPETIFRIRVVRGYISYSGFRFQSLCGLRNATMAEGLRLDDFYEKPNIKSVQALIQETDENQLELGYLLHYLAKDGCHKTHWLHLPLLFRKLQRMLNSITCMDKGEALYDSGAFLRPYHSYPAMPTRSIGQDCVNNAQIFLTTLGCGRDTWILVFSNGQCLIIGQPLLLYAMISAFGQRLFRFTDCLSCVVTACVDHGGIQLNSRRDEVKLTLATQDLATAVLRWKIHYGEARNAVTHGD